jgi:hypothetical protein
MSGVTGTNAAKCEKKIRETYKQQIHTLKSILSETIVPILHIHLPVNSKKQLTHLPATIVLNASREFFSENENTDKRLTPWLQCLYPELSRRRNQRLESERISIFFELLLGPSVITILSSESVHTIT